MPRTSTKPSRLPARFRRDAGARWRSGRSWKFRACRESRSPRRAVPPSFEMRFEMPSFETEMEDAMQFMLIVKGAPCEAGAAANEKLVAEVMTYTQELRKAGVLVE